MTETTARNARSTLKLFPVFLFLAVAGLFAVALRTGDPSKLPSALIGKPVPQSTFPAIDSVPTAGFTSADLAKGQVTVVNFWASWCAPCVEEHPLLTELAKSGVTLFGVNYKDDPAAARRFLGRFGNPFAALGSDGNGRNAIDWGVYGMPETFVVNGRGQIAFKHVGPLTRESIAAKIMPAIEAARRADAAAPAP